MGEVIDFVPFTTATPHGEIELLLVGEDPLITLIRRMTDAGHSLRGIAAFLREQASILDQVATRLAREQPAEQSNGAS